jgi:hypothetical protein
MSTCMPGRVQSERWSRVREAHGGERRGMASPFVVVALCGARRLQARVAMQPQLLKQVPDGQ